MQARRCTICRNSKKCKGTASMSARMERALILADKCWEKANNTAPEFVERYLELCEELLTTKPLVQGDEFREYCNMYKLYRDSKLHPNVWVSGVRALKALGWIEPLAKVVPTQSHNHMPSVTLWRSAVFYEEVKGVRHVPDT